MNGSMRSGTRPGIALVDDASYPISVGGTDRWLLTLGAGLQREPDAHHVWQRVTVRHFGCGEGGSHSPRRMQCSPAGYKERTPFHTPSAGLLRYRGPTVIVPNGIRCETVERAEASALTCEVIWVGRFFDCKNRGHRSVSVAAALPVRCIVDDGSEWVAPGSSLHRALVIVDSVTAGTGSAVKM